MLARRVRVCLCANFPQCKLHQRWPPKTILIDVISLCVTHPFSTTGNPSHSQPVTAPHNPPGNPPAKNKRICLDFTVAQTSQRRTHPCCQRTKQKSGKPPRAGVCTRTEPTRGFCLKTTDLAQHSDAHHLPHSMRAFHLIARTCFAHDGFFSAGSFRWQHWTRGGSGVALFLSQTASMNPTENSFFYLFFSLLRPTTFECVRSICRKKNWIFLNNKQHTQRLLRRHSSQIQPSLCNFLHTLTSDVFLLASFVLSSFAFSPPLSAPFSPDFFCSAEQGKRKLGKKGAAATNTDAPRSKTPCARWCACAREISERSSSKK